MNSTAAIGNARYLPNNPTFSSPFFEMYEVGQPIGGHVDETGLGMGYANPSGWGRVQDPFAGVMAGTNLRPEPTAEKRSGEAFGPIPDIFPSMQTIYHTTRAVGK